MSGSVTILIKAPNQMIDDQSIQCERSWTVKELKQHLSQVYPNKPHPRGQKLIYSGKLLADSAVLADVLKTYDGHENNTIHLVCASKENKMTTPTAPSAHPTNSSASSSESSYIPPQNASLPRSSTAPFVQHWQWPDNGIPSPLVTNNFYENSQFYMPSFPNNAGVPVTYPFDMPEEIWNRQMMLIRQAYGQYMTQLRDMPNTARFDPRFLSEAAQPQNPPEPPPQNNANEDDTEDDGAANRDWLEWVFFICRIVVLFSIVYFYSSPTRFVFVVTMAIILFNFNVDLERWRRRNNVPENPQQQEATPNQEPNQNNSRNLIPVVWTFLSSFFLSLFPDNEDFI